MALVMAMQFSIILTCVSASGEECWDLIRMSPTVELKLRLAKMAAGMAVPLTLCSVICLVLAVLGHPWLALLALVFSSGCASAGAWMQVAQIKPTPRRDVIKRGSGASGGAARNIVSSVIMLLGAGGLIAAAADQPILSAVLLGVAAIAVIACFVLVDMEEIKPREFSPDVSYLPPA